MLQSPSLARLSQFVASSRENNRSGADPSEVRRGEEEVSDAAVVEESDEEDWDLDEVMTAADANESGR